jgi:hypothetical protein
MLDLMRAIFVSAEFVVAIAAGCLLLTIPAAPALIGKKLLADPALLTWLLALPGGALLWAAVQAKEVLAPASPAQNVYLRAWPEYWRLKLRVLVGIGWLVATCIVAVAMWLFRDDLTQRAIGTLAIPAFLIPPISAASLWLASINVREIVER